MDALIVVTGRSRSGKTEFCRRASQALGYGYVNVGDLLEHELRRDGYPIRSRAEIGQEFFRHYDLQYYVSTVIKAAHNQLIIDGVRLSEAVKSLRNEFKCVHIHRQLQSDAPEDLDEAYAADLCKLRAVADLIVPWLSEVELLDDIIEKQLMPMMMRRSIGVTDVDLNLGEASHGVDR